MRVGASSAQDALEEASTYDVLSPLNAAPIDRIVLSSRAGIAEALELLAVPAPTLKHSEVFTILNRLREQLVHHKQTLFERTYLETGFIARDSMDIVDSAIEFLTDFETYVQEQGRRQQIIRHSYSAASHRNMRITDRPLRCVAAVVPQNASLTLAITIIASALYAGTRVLLRTSLQCGSTGALLRDLVERSHPLKSYAKVVNCLASDFIDVCCASPHVDLIHYIGSNQHALPVFQQAFSAGKSCFLDGQGNGLLYLDDTFPIPEAVRLITSGVIRYNGETCSSVNGALIHETVYKAVRAALIESFSKLKVGHPLDEGSQVGPLFSERHARSLRQTLQGSPRGKILCGGNVEGAYFTPAILEGIEAGDGIHCDGFFGPALWIQPVREEEVCSWFRANRFPLSDTILSTRRSVLRRMTNDSRAARICINEDPSIESMFEPWGGYAPSGLNPVSVWTEKYRQVYQLDGQIKDIMALCADPAENG